MKTLRAADLFTPIDRIVLGPDCVSNTHWIVRWSWLQECSLIEKIPDALRAELFKALVPNATNITTLEDPWPHIAQAAIGELKRFERTAVHICAQMDAFLFQATDGEFVAIWRGYAEMFELEELWGKDAASVLLNAPVLDKATLMIMPKRREWIPAIADEAYNLFGKCEQEAKSA